MVYFRVHYEKSRYGISGKSCNIHTDVISGELKDLILEVQLQIFNCLSVEGPYKILGSSSAIVLSHNIYKY